MLQGPVLRLTSLALLSISFGLAAEVASAAEVGPGSWAQWRHDAGHTGGTPLPVDISEPAIRWKYFTGGAVSQVRLHDLQGDGKAELVSIEGGQVVARGGSGAVLWDTPPVLAQQLVAVDDLDGDGVTEVIVTTARTVLVLAGPTGHVVWESPADLVQTMGTVLTTDVQGDGMPELVFADLSINVGADSTVYVYTFPDGMSSGTQLSKTELPGCGGESGRPIAMADVDGNGILDVVHPGNLYVCVFDAVSGKQLFESPELAAPVAIGSIFGADVDGDGRDEVFVFTDWTRGTTPTRHLFALDAQGEDLVQAWVKSPKDLVADHHRWPAEPVLDVDGDGTPEIVTAWWEGGAYRTEILDPVTGGVRLTLADRLTLKVADVDEDGTMEVLTADTVALSPGPFATKELYQLEGVGPAIAAKSLFSLPNASVRLGPFEAPFTGGNGELLVVLDSDEDGLADALQLRTLGPPSSVAGEIPLSGPENGVQTFAEGGKPLAAVLYASGEVAVLDSSLALVNDVDGDGSGDLVYRGFDSARVAGVVLGGDATLAVPRAGGLVTLLDPGSGTPFQPPDELGSAQGNLKQQPFFVELGALGQGYGVMTRMADGQLAVRVKTLTGEEAFTRVLGGVGGTFALSFDELLFDVEQDGTDEMFLLVRDNSMNEIAYWLFGLNCTDGASLWPPLLVPAPGGNIGAMSAMHTGTYAPALVLTVNTHRIIVGAATGQVLADSEGGTKHYYGLPIIEDLDADGHDEILAVGTSSGVLAMSDDLSVLWAGEPGGSTRAPGAVVTMAGGSVVVVGRTSAPLLDFYDGSTGAKQGSIALVGGESVDPAALPPEAVSAPVTEVLPIGALGSPPVEAFLVTSGDGFLYAVDALTHDIVWKLALGARLGTPALMDVDGDGSSEIAVPVANGHVVLIDQGSVQAPSWIRENDGQGPALSDAADVDEQEWTDRIHVNWSEVPDATGYTLRVLSENGTPLTEVASESKDTSAVIKGLSLQPGQKYLTSVRAVKVSVDVVASSDEVFSDGVTIVDTSPPSILSLDVEPPVISPDGDGEADIAVIAAQVEDKTGVDSYALTVSGDGLVRTFEGGVSATSALLEVEFDGLDDNGALMPTGLYSVDLTVTDIVGQSVSAASSVRVCNPPNTIAFEACVGPTKPEPDAGSSDDVSAIDAGSTDTTGEADVQTGAEVTGDGTGPIGSPDGLDGDASTVSPPDEKGCSCDAAGGMPPGDRFLLAIVVLALLFSTSRRRTVRE